jgi:hypothetical protein
MKTIILLMTIMLCQFATQHDAMAQTREETRTQAMIEVLQEQRAQNEMNQFSRASGQFQLRSEQDGRAVGAGDTVVVLLGLSLIFSLGYSEWRQSSQVSLSRHPASPAHDKVEGPANGVNTKAGNDKPKLLATIPVEPKEESIVERPRGRQVASETTQTRPRSATSMRSINSDCDLLRYLVCEHAKLRVTMS